MASDWGSAFRDQELTYVIALINDRPGDAVRDLAITSELPANLEVVAVKVANADAPAGVSDPQLQGNSIRLGVGELKRGERIEIAITARVRSDVAVGTRIVSQSELSFAGLTLPIYSNIVTVLVVGPPAAAQGVETETPTPTGTTEPTATGEPNATADVTATPDATGTPEPKAADQATATPGIVAQAPASSPQLPNTSSGVPLAGFALLGLTLLTRTVRIHRDQTRV
ncbi:MAG TPA: hypothetical protein PKC19_04315 [Roseiflexaceae bacterium]|nr:hypothetical protein [Roseiflexaceae bacterium]